MDELERYKNMTQEEAQACLDEMNACSHDCSHCSADCSSKTKKPAKKLIAVISGKGGTGKSTVTVLLAKALQDLGVKTAVLDADIAGSSIPALLGMYDPVVGDSDVMAPAKSAGGIDVMSMALISENPVDPIIWDGKAQAAAAVFLLTGTKWAEDTDVLLIDMPSGAGDIPLEYYTTMPMDNSLLVAVPGKFAENNLRRAVNLAEMLMVPVMGVVLNHSDNPENAPDILSDIPVVACLAEDPAIRTAANEGKMETYPADAFEFLARAIKDTL